MFVAVEPNGDKSFFGLDLSSVDCSAEVRAFLEDACNDGWVGPESSRVLATVLFTDIVSSTAKSAELGDGGWRALLKQHRAAIGRELSGFLPGEWRFYAVAA